MRAYPVVDLTRSGYQMRCVPSSHRHARASLLPLLLASGMFAACGDVTAHSTTPFAALDVSGAYGAPRYVSLAETGEVVQTATALPAPFVCPMPAAFPAGRAATVFSSGSLALFQGGTAEWKVARSTWYRTAPFGETGTVGGPETHQGTWAERPDGRIALAGLGPSAPVLLTPSGSGAYEASVTLACPGISDNATRAITLTLERRAQP